MGLAHKPGQNRVQGLVIDQRGFGRTLETSYPWKCKLTEGSEGCTKILPRLALDQGQALRYPDVRDQAETSAHLIIHESQPNRPV